MKTVKRASQLLKGFADQTRFRIVNLLAREELNVNQLCTLMGKEQSLMSKHLAQLKLLGIVSDRKDGLKVYYYLRKIKDEEYNRLISVVTKGFSNLTLIKEDMAKLKRLKVAQNYS